MGHWVYVRVKVPTGGINQPEGFMAHESLLFDLSLTPEALL